MRSPEYFRKEVDLCFVKNWILVGRVEEIPEAGSYITKDLPFGHASILIVNTKNGIKGFRNICRHRGNKIACAAAGQARAFTCTFHGWTYDCDGKLRGVPDEEAFLDLDKARLGLIPVHIDTWNGFIFVHLGNEIPAPLKEYLGDLYGFFNGFDFDKLNVTWSFKTEVEANWKICFDGFLEQYHFAFSHRTTVANTFLAPDNRFGRLGWHQWWDPHCVCSITGNPSPRRPPIGKVLGGPNVAGSLPPEPFVISKNMNPTQDDNWELDSVMLFPNFLIQAHPKSYNVWWFWPVSATKSVFEYRRYERAARNAGERFAQEYYLSLVRDTFLQDLFAFEHVQQSISSGAIDEFPLSLSEARVAYLHHQVNKRLAREHDPVIEGEGDVCSS
ncbi:MAG: hypothetical protein APF78_03770 [Sphingomonadales bacterium BRH_c3]|nr:MAG: hypothetical protein APF78_03770 [Sphingomonadales bacterium BRH_c3]